MIKKIDNLTFITFHSANLLLILLYLYPGSILGYLLYGNFSSQPQITKDFIISSNHFYAFFLLSMLGIFAYRKSKKINNLMIYLIFISFTLEIMHLVIPERSFQFNDLFGNLLGSLAIIIISTIFWLIKNIIEKKNILFFNFKKKNWPFLILLLLIYVQIICGAFVSGLDAGQIYQTWPLMGQSYFPDDIIISDLNSFIDFNSHSMVQFYHRNLAYLISIYVLALSFYIFNKDLRKLIKPLKLLVYFLLLQITLGILTLVGGLNIYLASAHQISSVLLVFSAINLYYLQAK